MNCKAHIFNQTSISRNFNPNPKIKLILLGNFAIFLTVKLFLQKLAKIIEAVILGHFYITSTLFLQVLLHFFLKHSFVSTKIA